MTDETEFARRCLQAKLNSEAAERPDLEAKYGQVWNTEQLQQDFEVIGFAAPFVAIKRKSDNCKGSLAFQHYPRFYFTFKPHKEN